MVKEQPKQSPRPVVIGHRTVAEVAFVGPFGVGKTTAVRTLSTGEIVLTEVATAAWQQSGRRSAAQKKTTTVGLDFGIWESPFGRISLYGTPGQSRFRLSGTSTVPPGTRSILLLYGHTSYAVEEAEEWLRYLKADEMSSTLTVAVTRLGDGPPLEKFEECVRSFSTDIPTLAADPRNIADIERVVSTALADLNRPKREDRIT